MGRQVLGWTMVLAAMAGLVIADDKKPAADDTAGAGKLQRKSFEKEVTIKLKYDYLLYLPQGYGKDDKKAWPLVLFLHGLGDKIARLEKSGLPRQVAQKKDTSFILVAPQNPGRGWEPRGLGALLDDIEAKYKVDKDRVYVTGLSMGGFGTWSLAGTYPDRFAALIPICGGGNASDAKKIKHLPIWVFHGAKDTTVPSSRSDAMVKALKDAGAKDVQYTLYPDAGHDSWTPTYKNPKVWDWLLKQKRGGKKE